MIKRRTSIGPAERSLLLRSTACGRLPALLLAALVLAIGGCLTPQARRQAVLHQRLDEILLRLGDSGATVTARVLELPEGREIYGRDTDVPFTPASNMKIPVSAAGLDMFGAGHTFKTYLALDGEDLWVIGTGDPGIGDPRLARQRGSTPVGVFDEWAAALKRRGVERIAGDLVYYDGALDGQWVHPSWGDDVLHWYGAPVSGLNFNDNCVDITIYPTEKGQPVRFEVMPPVQNITVINECLTADRHEPKIEKLAGGDIYRLAGTCAEQAELKSKPVGNPGAFFCDALRTHLAARGIVIAGGIRRAAAPPGQYADPQRTGAVPGAPRRSPAADAGFVPPADSIVAVHETSVRDILGRINTNSQNFFAEALCKLTGQAFAATQGRSVPGSWADGDAAIRAFLRRNGIADSGLVVADGSGLSEENKLTSRLLTDLFAVMFRRPDGPAFIDSLAQGGVNGTLERRYEGLQGHVFAKTGYIEGVRALSGYVRTYDGQWLTFSIIYNHIPGDVRPYEQLQDEAVRLLLHWPNIEALPGPQAGRAAGRRAAPAVQPSATDDRSPHPRRAAA